MSDENFLETTISKLKCLNVKYNQISPVRNKMLSFEPQLHQSLSNRDFGKFPIVPKCPGVINPKPTTVDILAFLGCNRTDKCNQS